MSVNIALPHQSVSQAVSGVSAAFGSMDTTKPIGNAVWRFISTTACFIDQGSAPVATSSSMAVAANEVVYVDGSQGAKIAVLQQAAGGTATLTPIFHL